MSFKDKAFVLALVTTIAAPAPAWAIGGGLGCADLPETNRAQGTLQGLSTCDMTVEEARRVLGYAAPAPYAHHRHHRVRAPQPY